MCNICYVENLRRAEDRKTKLIVLASLLPLPRDPWQYVSQVSSGTGISFPPSVCDSREKGSDNNWITPSLAENVLSVFESDITACKNCPTLGVNLCRALSLRVSVGASHHPSASHSSDIWRFIILSVFSSLLLIGQICSTLPSDWSILPLIPASDVIPLCTFFAGLMLSTLWWYPGEKWPSVAVTKYRRMTRNIQRPDMTRAGGVMNTWPVVRDHEQCV